jgi:hypothetical protein
MLQFLLNDQRLRLGLEAIPLNSLRTSELLLLPYEEEPVRFFIQDSAIYFNNGSGGFDARAMYFSQIPIAFKIEVDTSTDNHYFTCSVMYEDATEAQVNCLCHHLYSRLGQRGYDFTSPLAVDEACGIYLE